MRIFHGLLELAHEASLEDVGALHGSQLTLVMQPALRIATTSEDQTAKIWCAATGECLRTLVGHAGHVFSAAFSPDGERLVTGSEDQTAKIWSTATGECLRMLIGHTSHVFSVAFSPVGERLVTGSCDQTAKPRSGAQRRVSASARSWMAMVPSSR